MKSAATLALVATILVAVIFSVSTRTHCGDEDDQVLNYVIGRASGGDLAAIRPLYERARRERVRPEEEFWALKGAMEGDTFFRHRYVELYSEHGDEEKARIRDAIRKMPKRPGVECLLAALTSKPLGANCKE